MTTVPKLIEELLSLKPPVAVGVILVSEQVAAGCVADVKNPVWVSSPCPIEFEVPIRRMLVCAPDVVDEVIAAHNAVQMADQWIWTWPFFDDGY